MIWDHKSVFGFSQRNAPLVKRCFLFCRPRHSVPNMAGDDKSGAKSRCLPRVQTSKVPLINYGSSHKDRHVYVDVYIAISNQPRPQGLLLVQNGGRRNPWPRLPKWLQKFVTISSRTHDKMSSFRLNNSFQIAENKQGCHTLEETSEKANSSCVT